MGGQHKEPYSEDSDGLMIFKLLPKAWVLPAVPLASGLLHIFLYVNREPLYPPLLYGGVTALVLGAIYGGLILTSRVLVTRTALDVRDYGVRKLVEFKNLRRVYTIPSSFSTILALEDRYAGTAFVYLGYWTNESEMLREAAPHIVEAGIDCSPGAARLLGVEASYGFTDNIRTHLLEVTLGGIWLFSSTIMPLLVGMLLYALLNVR